jgi:hypothetical protein
MNCIGDRNPRAQVGTRLVELDQVVQPLVIEGVEIFKESSLVKLDEFLLDRGIFE